MSAKSKQGSRSKSYSGAESFSIMPRPPAPSTTRRLTVQPTPNILLHEAPSPMQERRRKASNHNNNNRRRQQQEGGEGSGRSSVVGLSTPVEFMRALLRRVSVTEATGGVLLQQQDVEVDQQQQQHEEEESRWQMDSYQRDLLRRSWSDDFDFLYNLGADIYAYIFETAPDAKLLFPTVAKHGDNWRDSTDFKSQALKFVQVLSHAVKNMYHLERLDQMLFKVGAAHVRLVKRGFKLEYWELFESAIAYAMELQLAKSSQLSEREKSDAIKLWRVLAAYIVKKMRKGYSEEEQGQRLTSSADNNSSTSSSPPLPSSTPVVSTRKFSSAFRSKRL